MPTLTIPNIFVGATNAVSADVNTNFDTVRSFIQTNCIQADGSVPFSVVPSGPATDPSSANQLVRKQYVDNNFSHKIGFAQIVASQAGISAVTDVTGLTATWTALAGVYYKITVECLLSAVTADVTADIILADAANVQLQRRITLVASGQSEAMTTTLVYSPGAGSKTVKARCQRSSGAGTVTVTAGATLPAFILVELLGP